MDNTSVNERLEFISSWPPESDFACTHVSSSQIKSPQNAGSEIVEKKETYYDSVRQKQLEVEKVS